MTGQPETADLGEGFLRNTAEREAAHRYARLFEASPDRTEDKLAHAAKYMRRQDLTRLLARYEIFKRILHVKGSIVECGVYRGSGLMAWANFAAVLEPTNLMRKVYGFDSFGGFPSVGPRDKGESREARPGDLRADCLGELRQLVHAYDLNRPLGHVPRVELFPGDASVTIPEMIKAKPHLVVSLLFLDFDLYEPTKVALEHFVPRMPRGAIIAFDELDNPAWPGETLAALDTLGLRKLRLERLDFDPYIGFAVIE
jgi:hypothetical protein